MELSVIIVSYNVRNFLEQCLLSVRKASENIESEIFVVDNNSADGSCSMVANGFPEVRLIMNLDNKGFSAANNQALKLASGRFILLLNPDTIVEEDTFKKCMNFMDNHPDAGAAGVRMIDGKGRILPESKRALPTPKTAFFKMAGFSYLFPRSGFFNKYYLGHIRNYETAQADVLSGAFMFLRREAVIKTGLMDEDFFMYGEDIDYCYRLKKAGFNNYYYPEIKIIHYKGESTKKDNLNVRIFFYKAMSLFVRKHFTNGSFKTFTLMIHLAIILMAGLSLFKTILKRVFLPLSDGALAYLIYTITTKFWESQRFGEGYVYPRTFTLILIPLYALIILFSIELFSGFRSPSKVMDSIKGIFAGTVIILIIYALLPLDLRFSRAIIIIGGLISFIVIPLFRIILSLILPEIAENPFLRRRRTVIVSSPGGYDRIKDLLSKSGLQKRIAGRVSIYKEDMQEEVLGNLDQIREVIRINRIKEVIFTTRELNASQIIDSMHHISDLKINIKIASSDEKYILGSRYVKTGEAIL